MLGEKREEEEEERRGSSEVDPVEGVGFEPT
jgi:hypothetical protein